MKILVGHEESQVVTKAFRNKGFEAYSCDLKPCSGGHPEWHIQDDVFLAINGWKKVVFLGECIYEDWDETGEFPICPNCLIDYENCSCPGPTQEDENDNPLEYMELNGNLYGRKYGFKWDLGIFFPDCTYLTISAEWAYKDGPFHQQINPGTLVGAKRREAREKAIEHVKALWNSDINKVAIENPVGKLNTSWKTPTQIIQPYQFGENASKKTCLWLKNLPKLKPTVKISNYVKPRVIGRKKLYGNQTDSGQNKLSPSYLRGEIRSKTFPGIAKAMADQWTRFIENEKPIGKQTKIF